LERADLKRQAIGFWGRKFKGLACRGVMDMPKSGGRLEIYLVDMAMLARQIFLVGR
jgi:hypothetical protein